MVNVGDEDVDETSGVENQLLGGFLAVVDEPSLKTNQNNFGYFWLWHKILNMPSADRGRLD